VRVLFIAYYYPPLEGAGVARAVNIVKHMRAAGHGVYILTHSYHGDCLDDRELLRIHDASFNRQRSGPRRVAWFCRRLWCEARNRIGIYASIYETWQKRVLDHSDEIVKLTRPEAILATYPPVENLEIGLHFAQKHNLPLIADFRDGMLFEAIESKRLRRFACVRRAYATIEQQVAKKAAALLTVSEPLSRYFREKYGHSCVATVPNGFDPDETQLELPDIDLEADRFHIVHSGRFSLSDAGCTIIPLVHALDSLLTDRPELVRTMRLHLLGELSRREKSLLAGLVRRGVARIHGPVSRFRALAFQRRADLLLLVTAPGRSSVATTKIFEYLQARRPILALAPRSFAAEIIEKSGSGWVVPPLDVNEIRRLLARIIDDRVFYQGIDLSAAAIADYSITVSLRQLSELLQASDRNPPA
jgi:glycosyltransferase involved in cell wall biosynthesis